MLSYGEIQLRLANERIQERIEEASRPRLVPRDERGLLRRLVGNSMVAIGQRLASGPSPHNPSNGACEEVGAA